MTRNDLKRSLAGWATCLGLCFPLVGTGAELRTTIGNREVSRQVSYVFEDDAPEGEDEEVVATPPARKTRSAAPAKGARQGQPMRRDHAVKQVAGYSPSVMSEGEIVYGDEMLSDGCCFEDDCGICPNDYGIWADAEFLLWWRRGMELPPLVTTSPTGTAFANAGVLGQAGTTVLFGGESEGGQVRPGGRLTLGGWIDPEHCWGITGRFFMLGEENINYAVASDGNGSPILAIPFFDEVLGRENALVLAYPTAPDQRTGGVSITGSSDVLGGDALLRMRWYADPIVRIDLLAGYQTSRITGDVVISGSSTVPGQFRQDFTDSFSTRNEFHGGCLGIYSEYDAGTWRISSLLKMGLGNMSENVQIQGYNVIRTPPDSNAPVILNSGLFAQASNIGSFSKDDFAIVPEVNVNMSWRATERLELSVGYTFIGWSSVLLPASEIDRHVDDTQAVALPQPQLSSVGYWVQGINLGAQYRY